MRKVIRQAMLFFMLFQLQYEAIHSASTTYLVGDDEGWDPIIDLEGWTKGKNFHAGDILGIYTLLSTGFKLINGVKTN